MKKLLIGAISFLFLQSSFAYHIPSPGGYQFYDVGSIISLVESLNGEKCNLRGMIKEGVPGSRASSPVLVNSDKAIVLDFGMSTIRLAVNGAFEDRRSGISFTQEEIQIRSAYNLSSIGGLKSYTDLTVKIENDKIVGYEAVRIDEESGFFGIKHSTIPLFKCK